MEIVSIRPIFGVYVRSYLHTTPVALVATKSLVIYPKLKATTEKDNTIHNSTVI